MGPATTTILLFRLLNNSQPFGALFAYFTRIEYRVYANSAWTSWGPPQQRSLSKRPVLRSLLYQSSAHPSRELLLREVARVLDFWTESSTLQSDQKTQGQRLLHSSAFEWPSLLSSGWIKQIRRCRTCWLIIFSFDYLAQASEKSHQSHHLMVSTYTLFCCLLVISSLSTVY